MKRKTLTLLAALLMLALALAAPLNAGALDQTADSQYRLLGDPADPGVPIIPADPGEESRPAASGPAWASDTGGAPVFEEPAEGLYANQTLYPVSIAMNYTTFFAAADWSYYSYPPNMVSFFDCRGLYNVIYFSDMDERLHVQRYDGDMKLASAFTLAPRYPMWGAAACDDEGNYYVIWAQNDTASQNAVVTCAAKYDYNGNFLGECNITGFDSLPFNSEGLEGDYWGTKLPFDAGNCSVAVKNGVLACNYAREMYSGHQSNFVFYVDCRTMSRIPGYSGFYSVPYCSHSFDQRIIITSDGGYLTANHGDASHRSFYLSKMAADRYIEGNLDTFHFREGANRDHGYNETYAQLGGIAETDSAYVLLASSERTLSLANAPTNQNYCGHSEARDLFIQYVKKDFYNYSDGPAKYAVSGETRRATGVRPESSYTNLYLTGSEVDYGVIWLTAYDKDHYANNPQLVKTDDGRLVVLWEKLDYETYTGVTYYAILGSDGRVLQQPLPLKDSYLNANIDPVYHEGKVYWTTRDRYGSYIHCLEIDGGEPLIDLESLGTLSLSQDSFTYDGTEKRPAVTVTAAGRTLNEGEHYTVAYTDNVGEGEAKVTVTGINTCSGTLEQTFQIRLAAPTLTRDGDKVRLSVPAQGSVTIVYTRDGSEPSAGNGTRYSGRDFTLDVFPGYLKAIAIDSFGHPSPVSSLTLYQVKLDQSVLYLGKGDQAPLTATVLPTDGEDTSVTWSSSDPAVAGVDQKGQVTALGLGRATVTATSSDGNSVASCQVEVVIPVSSLILEQREYELYTGDTLQLDVKVEPGDASNKNLIYTVSDPTVLKADAAGQLTALAGGSVEVTVRPEAGTGEVSCHILVRWRVRDLFNDMFEKDWWYDAVQYAYDNGVMNGKGAYFDPQGNLTREQFAQVLYNHCGAPEIGEAVNPFSDVKKSGWYYQAVLWAYQNGVAAGRGATFGVNDNITRQELARMLYNYAKMKGYDLEMSEGVIESYIDYDQVAVWGREGFDWAVSQGIITGKGTPGDVANYRLDPNGKATRAECAMMMMRLLLKNGD